MNLKRKLVFIITALAVCLCLFAACGPTEDSSAGKYTVTFNYNYGDGPADYTQLVDNGGTVTPPSDPERTNFSFDGWFTDVRCTAKADFEYAVTADITYYAGWTQTAAVVTFDFNYPGTVSTTAVVRMGGLATQPQAPVREGYVFAGWYTDAGCTAAFSFDDKITSDIKLYAAWEEASEETVNVVFSYNYGNAGNYYSVTINAGRRIAKPADPVRTDGYAFIGWYADAACGETYNFNTFIREDITIYAQWYKIHTFEAEYTNLSGMVGTGWSSTVEELGLIDEDNLDGGASNGFYVGYMYVTGNTLTYNITSKEDVDNCILVLRLTGEGSDFTLNDEEMLVKVNDTVLEFETLVFDDIPDINGGTRRPFSNHVINTGVSLTKGNNVIKLIINNEKSLGGTMAATAPMFDCMYIYTNADIDWTEGECYTANLDGRL